MNIQTNSSLSFQSAVSSNTVAKQREKVLAVVREFPYRTSRELARKVNDGVLTHEAFHKRLPELRAQGKVGSPYSRVCTVTGKRAQIWAIL